MSARRAACLVCAAALAAAVLLCAAAAPPAALYREKTCEAAGAVWTLAGGRLTAVRAAGEPYWRSEDGWRVQDFYIGDVTGGGGTELLVLLWRRGSFGPSRPFWVRCDDRRWSQHIFLYRLEADGPRPLWMASAMRPRAREIFLEENGTLRLVTEAGEETRWHWHGFGLERCVGTDFAMFKMGCAHFSHRSVVPPSPHCIFDAAGAPVAPARRNGLRYVQNGLRPFLTPLRRSSFSPLHLRFASMQRGPRSRPRFARNAGAQRPRSSRRARRDLVSVGNARAEKKPSPVGEGGICRRQMTDEGILRNTKQLCRQEELPSSVACGDSFPQGGSLYWRERACPPESLPLEGKPSGRERSRSARARSAAKRGRMFLF